MATKHNRYRENFSLRGYNTFGIDVKARFYAEADSVHSLSEILEEAGSHNRELFILGGGSNILLMGDLEKVVVRNCIGGVEVLQEEGNLVRVKVGSGMVWHDFVQYSVTNGWGGVENLSLIPGTVGASPIQNIGAYGVEIKDVFEELHAVNMVTGEFRSFNLQECRFGYRDSAFKQELRGKWVITDVVFRLHKSGEVNTTYGDIQNVLRVMGVASPGVADVSRAVIQIRQSKLPDPAVIGNAGSFFKNPEVPVTFFEELKDRFPSVPGYMNGQVVKVPAGWLIETAGWKGYREGAVGVHERQALVLVNYGGAAGSDIRAMAVRIQESVRDKFGIELQAEVNFIGE